MEKKPKTSPAIQKQDGPDNQAKGKTMAPPPFQLKSEEAPVQMKLANEDLVMRGGLSAPETLIDNQSRDKRGHISANSAPGRSLEELAKSPPLPNGQLTVTTVGEIRAVQNDQGKNMDVIEDPTRNNELHASIDPFNKALSQDEAKRLSGAFQPTKNLWQAKK